MYLALRRGGPAGAGERDRYGRLLAYVRLEDGRLLNALLLEQGQARVYRRCQCSRLGWFQALEQEARLLEELMSGRLPPGALVAAESGG